MAEIRLPFRDRNQPLDAEALSLPNALEDRQQRRVVLQLFLDGMSDGMRTVGDVLHRFERASPAERRQIVDRARTAAGMETIGMEEAGRAYQARLASPREPARDARGCALQLCPVAGCKAFAVDPATGEHLPTRERKWHCDRHRDQAEPRDLEAWTSSLRFGPTGSIVDTEAQEAEAERQRTEAETRRRRREADQAERRKVADEEVARERDQRDDLERNTPAGFPLP